MTPTLRTCAFAGLAAFAFVMPAFADPPQPKIVVIDRAAILQFSKVGQDIAKQMQAAATQAKADLSGQAKSIQAEERTLQQQVAILAPDVKAKRLAAFQAKAQSLQGAAQRNKAGGGEEKAAHDVFLTSCCPAGRRHTAHSRWRGDALRPAWCRVSAAGCRRPAPW